MKKILITCSSIFILSVYIMSCGEGTDTYTKEAPLPSFKDGQIKEDILQFVRAVSDENNEAYVDPENRIVVFDNDGTLWAEQPLPSQLYFAGDRLRQLASQGDYDWESQLPYSAVIARDSSQMMKFSKSDIIKIVGKAHATTDVDSFGLFVNQWMDTAIHPILGRKYSDCVYKPMLELLELLREYDFKIFIVSGGSMEFMRAWAPGIYDIEKANIIGTSFKTVTLQKGDSIRLSQTEDFEFNDDHEGKVIAINKFIGQKPILVVGNSDGDLEMMEYATTESLYATYILYVDHDDAEREFLYDEHVLSGALVKGKEVAASKGWSVLSMKNDWLEVWKD